MLVGVSFSCDPRLMGFLQNEPRSLQPMYEAGTDTTIGVFVLQVYNLQRIP